MSRRVHGLRLGSSRSPLVQAFELHAFASDPAPRDELAARQGVHEEVVMEATTLFEPEVMPDSHHESSARSARTVHGVERVASTVLGGLALASGLRQRSSGGAMLAILGGEMIYRGVTGVCPLYGAMGISTAGSEGKTSPVKVDWHH